jgi:hypothetical protein
VWTKDDTSDPPRVIYTPQFESGITRVIYDPNADAGKRLIAEMSYLHFPGETLADLDKAFSID